jgi:hypothetical protein
MVQRLSSVALAACELMVLVLVSLCVVTGIASDIPLAIALVGGGVLAVLFFMATLQTAAGNPSKHFPRELVAQHGRLQVSSPSRKSTMRLKECEWRDGTTWDALGDDSWVWFPRRPAIIIRHRLGQGSAVCGLSAAMRDKWRVLLTSERVPTREPLDEFDASKVHCALLKLVILWVRLGICIASGWAGATFALWLTRDPGWGFAGACTGAAAAMLGQLVFKWINEPPRGAAGATRRRIIRAVGYYLAFGGALAVVIAIGRLKSWVPYLGAHVVAGAVTCGLGTAAQRLRVWLWPTRGAGLHQELPRPSIRGARRGLKVAASCISTISVGAVSSGVSFAVTGLESWAIAGFIGGFFGTFLTVLLIANRGLFQLAREWRNPWIVAKAMNGYVFLGFLVPLIARASVLEMLISVAFFTALGSVACLAVSRGSAGRS